MRSSSNISATGRTGPRCFRRSGDFRRYRVLEMVNFITTELHKRFGSLFSPDATDEMKQLVDARPWQEARLCRPAARRRPVPVRRSADPARPLSVRDDRLGGQNSSVSTNGPTSAAFRERMMRARGCSPRASVRRIARGANRRGLERPRNDANSTSPTTSSKSRRWRASSRPMQSRRSPPSGTRSTSSRGHDPRGGRARLWRDLRLRGKRRDRPGPARSGADHGGDGLRLPVDQRVHLDPQHGELDDRPLRFGRSEAEIPALDDHHGADGQLLPDRAVVGLGRRGAEDQGGARRRSLCRLRIQGVHLRRRRERDLRDHGPHRRGGPEGHFLPGDRKGHEGRQLRRAGKEARLAFAANRAGQFR